MRPESFNVILENTQSDQKHLCRLFLFAQASCLKDDELEHIRLQIQNRLGYSDPQFFEAMQQTTLEWQNKLTRLELEAQSLPALEAFEKKYSRTDPVVMAQMRSYLAKSLVRACSRLSIQTGHSYLKSKTLHLLSDLLRDPDELQPVLKDIEYPYRRVMQNEWRIGDDTFPLMIIMDTQLLADYLENTLITPSPARKEMLLEYLRNTKRYDTDRMRIFLNSSKHNSSKNA